MKSANALFPCYVTTFLIFYLKLQNLKKSSVWLQAYNMNIDFFL